MKNRHKPAVRAIERDFPFEHLSQIAEVESWRKEVHRPIYHLHKWWAQRLGSVFRATILGSALPPKANIIDAFYKPTDLKDTVVFDPFMGSGTTIGEAHKLGCIAIGRDINPVAYRTVCTALGPLDRSRVLEAFDRLNLTTGQRVRDLYKTTDEKGEPCDTLYYFWVKAVSCAKCDERVELFSSYIFARHAYVKKFPKVHIFCPGCRNIFAGDFNSERARCGDCGHAFNPHEGPAKRQTVVCRKCSEEFPIARAARSGDGPPAHILYAKLIVTSNGVKKYLRATPEDIAKYSDASKQLQSLKLQLPPIKIEPGFNTDQAINYGYRYWHQFFNDRQLLGLGLLAEGIRALPDSTEKSALAIILSGTLEFNNMFASYKGEGTGAVRHMFSHHILKPERMPIEANIWGTDYSSGSFSTLFKSRLLRAIDYREDPFELGVKSENGKLKSTKVIGTAPAITGNVILGVPQSRADCNGKTIYLSCGNSSESGLADKSVDLVITDPPFFDNVHYSELADFFFVWQGLIFGESRSAGTTRHANEVQDGDPGKFSLKLQNVFAECCRVLSDNGLLVFSYHHSREDGWSAVLNSICRSGFSVVQSHPIKAEMSVATPKSQAKEPIDLDILIVCKKRSVDHRPRMTAPESMAEAFSAAGDKISRFNSTGRLLSRNDVRIVFISESIRLLSAGRSPDELSADYLLAISAAKEQNERLFINQSLPPANQRTGVQPEPVQRE